jgi:hypothetical protein
MDGKTVIPHLCAQSARRARSVESGPPDHVEGTFDWAGQDRLTPGATRRIHPGLAFAQFLRFISRTLEDHHAQINFILGHF